jgi:hypothetical protein
MPADSTPKFSLHRAGPSRGHFGWLCQLIPPRHSPHRPIARPPHRPAGPSRGLAGPCAAGAGGSAAGVGLTAPKVRERRRWPGCLTRLRGQRASAGFVMSSWIVDRPRGRFSWQCQPITPTFAPPPNRPAGPSRGHFGWQFQLIPPRHSHSTAPAHLGVVWAGHASSFLPDILTRPRRPISGSFGLAMPADFTPTFAPPPDRPIA